MKAEISSVRKTNRDELAEERKKLADNLAALAA